MKKIVVNVLIILYFLVAVVVTYALLSYNKYNIVETKDKYILTIKEDNPDFKKSDLLVVKKSLLNFSFISYNSVFMDNKFSFKRLFCSVKFLLIFSKLTAISERTETVSLLSSVVFSFIF